MILSFVALAGAAAAAVPPLCQDETRLEVGEEWFEAGAVRDEAMVYSLQLDSPGMLRLLVEGVDGSYQRLRFLGRDCQRGGFTYVDRFDHEQLLWVARAGTYFFSVSATAGSDASFYVLPVWAREGAVQRADVDGVAYPEMRNGDGDGSTLVDIDDIPIEGSVSVGSYRGTPEMRNGDGDGSTLVDIDDIPIEGSVSVGSYRGTPEMRNGDGDGSTLVDIDDIPIEGSVSVGSYRGAPEMRNGDGDGSTLVDIDDIPIEGSVSVSSHRGTPEMRNGDGDGSTLVDIDDIPIEGSAATAGVADLGDIPVHVPVDGYLVINSQSPANILTSLFREARDGSWWQVAGDSLLSSEPTIVAVGKGTYSVRLSTDKAVLAPSHLMLRFIPSPGI